MAQAQLSKTAQQRVREFVNSPEGQQVILLMRMKGRKRGTDEDAIRRAHEFEGWQGAVDFLEEIGAKPERAAPDADNYEGLDWNGPDPISPQPPTGKRR